MENKPRLLRITTVPISLKLLLNGQLSFFQQQGYEVLAVSSSGPEIKSLTDKGIAHTVIPMTRKITPLQDLHALFLLIGVIRKFKPSIIHSHTPKAGLLGMLAGWICGVPVRLHTVAGLPLMEATGMKKRLLIFTEKLTYTFATGIYVNSQGLLSYIQQHISRSRKFNIIGKGSSNGIDTEFYQRTDALEATARQLREQHGIASEDLVFSFVGRIVKDKGIAEAINAYRNLTTVLPDRKIFFLMVGPFEQDLDPLAPEDYEFIHKEKRVILAGFQQDVRPWIIASDVFVFPSYREGFPNVVMQASCLEVPCIVSDINGCNEIISHEKTGLIVKPKDAHELLIAMKILAEDPRKIKSYASATREFVAGNFSQRNVWDLLRKEYERLLHSN